MAGRRSFIWQFFTAMEGMKAMCNFCKMIISHKSTVTNMKSHLSRKHPTIILPNPKMTSQPIRSAMSTATGDCNPKPHPIASRSTVSIMPAQPADIFPRHDPVVGTSRSTVSIMPAQPAEIFLRHDPVVGTSRSTVSIMPAQPADIFLHHDPVVGTSTDLPKATSIKIQTPTEVIEGEGPSISLETSSNETSEVNLKKSAATKRCIKSRIRSSKKKKMQTLEQCLDKAFEILQPAAEVDDCHHFGNLVASKLRTHDEIARCAIECDILNIFVRASAGYYIRVADLPSGIIEQSRSSYSASPAFSDSTSSQPEQQTESQSQNLT